MAAASRPTSTSAVEDDLRLVLVEVARGIRGQVDGADGAGVTLLLGGRVVYGCADDFASAVDAVQYRLMQGPCVDATTSGGVVRSTTIGQGEPRWVDFSDAAAALALRSVVSVPLRATGAVIGSLNLYGRQPHGFDGFDDPAARRAGERVEPAIRNARLVAVAAVNSAVLRSRPAAGLGGPRGSARRTQQVRGVRSRPR